MEERTEAVGPTAASREAVEDAGGAQASRVRASERLTIRRLAGNEYPRWIRSGALLAAGGYTISVLLSVFISGAGMFPNAWSEILAALACYAAVPVARRYPSRAAALVLVAVGAELQFGFLSSVRPYTIGSLVTSLLVVTAGIMIGSRGALYFALAGSLLTPVLVFVALKRQGLNPFADGDVVRYYSVHAVNLMGTWLMVTLGLRAFARALEQSRLSEQRAEDTIRLAPDGILIVDATGAVTSMNPAAERVLGVAHRHWLGSAVNDLLEAAGADVEVRAVLHPGRTLGLPLAVAVHRPEGGTVHVEVTSRRMDDGFEQWMLRDVSERVRAESARREMELQLAHVQRMEAVGQLAGGIAHDFNNLLTAVGASAEMLRQDALRAEDLELIDEILASQERGRTLTRQLLAFARRDVVQARVFDLAEQVNDLRRLLARVAGERVRFSFHINADCRVRADVGQMEQALVNLVSNARDAMPDGGECRIAVARHGDEVRLEVTDTGIGMDAATRGRVFEPFFTTKPRGKGTGLGLASVHGIVLASGGSVRLESAPGSGTTVSLVLPFVDAPLEFGPPAPTPTEVPRDEGAILVAEDDDAIRATVRRILARAGYAVTLATDGLEAARIAEASSTPFDLVLTDVIMPALTGPQLAARLRARWPALPVLFMSGYPEDALADVPDLALDRDFIAKPFSPADLERRVGELMAARRQ